VKVIASMGADLALRDIPAHAQRVEQLGYHALSVPEAQHEGTLSALLALEHTTRLRVGTAVLVAFARSPMLAAQAAWDLQALSGGRFELGLGTQVKGNVVGRFGMPWSAPAARLRDYVGAVRACFETFQHAAELDYHSDAYTLNRMQPFFNPGPLDCDPPAILMGAIGPIMTRTVGEVADAIQTHPTNSEARYLREVTWPCIEEGRRRAGRSDRVELAAGPMIATGPTREAVATALQAARQTLVFTLSTPAYWPALEHHGWLDVGHQLRDATRAGKWQEMDALVPDEIIDKFVPAGTYDEIAPLLLEQYGGIADRILFPVPQDPACDAAARKVIEELAAG
jgi:probable F420-dependent oxidoreductase